MPSLHAILELARHMPCHHSCNFWACDTCVLLSLHAIPELVGHMPYHHYMQVWSIWGKCHAIIKCNSQAFEAYVIPSAITSHWFTLVCITSCYIILHRTLSLIDPMSPKPCCLHDMCHVLIICSPGACLGICHLLLHAVLELAMYVSCHHCMQFPSLWHICHAIITCSSGACMAYAMPPLHAILECVGHMPCPH